jgi:hypothetical protein
MLVNSNSLRINVLRHRRDLQCGFLHMQLRVRQTENNLFIQLRVLQTENDLFIFEEASKKSVGRDREWCGGLRVTGGCHGALAFPWLLGLLWEEKEA